MLVATIIFAWIFSGWPLSAAQAPSFSFPAQGVGIAVNDKSEAKIDFEGLSFNLPNGAGEVELYALPDECLGTEAEIKQKILTYPYCGDPIGFAVMRPNDYFWKIDRPARFLIGYCKNADSIDCGDHPENFEILFISDTAPNPALPAGKHQFLPKL